MTINLTVPKTTSGWPLTPADSFVQAPWNDSPEHPVATEPAPNIAVSRVDGGTVNLNWGIDSGRAPRADAWLKIQMRGSIPISFYLVDWGDGGSPEAVNGLDVENLTLRLSHTFLADSILIQVAAYDADLNLVEADSVALSITRSSDYLIHQYRIERFKGRYNYHVYNRRWIPDWTDYTGSVYQTNFNDYDAPSRWNWGYRLWLREVDDQGRPDLIMRPSSWVDTGTGEGS
jgi:hypothetical protein